MLTFSIFIDIYSAYVDDVDTSIYNVDVFNKYKHMAANRIWREHDHKKPYFLQIRQGSSPPLINHLVLVNWVIIRAGCPFTRLQVQVSPRC